MHVYVYAYIHIYIHMHIYVYIYNHTKPCPPKLFNQSMNSEYWVEYDSKNAYRFPIILNPNP